MASILGKWSLSSSIASLVDLFHRNRCKIIVDHFLSYGGWRYPRSHNHKEKCGILLIMAEPR